MAVEVRGLVDRRGAAHHGHRDPEPGASTWGCSPRPSRSATLIVAGDQGHDARPDRLGEGKSY